MDINFLKKGQDYDKLPIRYVIFISENGYKCSDKPLRQFSTHADDDGEVLGDEAYIIYVNGKNKEDTELGRLMMDMNNPDPDTMYNKFLSEIVGYYKKSKKGREKIMTVTEKIYNAGVDEGLNKGKLNTLFELIKDGIVTIEIAAKKANMSIEEFTNQMKLAGYNI